MRGLPSRSARSRTGISPVEARPAAPSLHFKKIGRFRSVRVGLRYRALAVEVADGLVWFWIGSHAEYDRLIGSSRNAE
jgi:hypothetical protein